VELACDALVLAATGTALPAGCHWKSTHPLTQRIAALKRPLPELDASQTIPAQVRQALPTLPAARELALEPAGQLFQSATPAGKTQLRRCKLSRAPDRTTS